MGSTRKRSVVLSTAVGSVNSIITILLLFWLRTIVLQNFSVEYVGLYSFLTQTVGVLNGIDGGISSALFMKIHKPIAQNDIEGIRRYFFLIRLIFTIRSVLVFGVGMIIGAVLPHFVSTTIELGYIYKCYFLYLALCSLNFCVIYYYFMLETLQRRYVASIIIGITDIIVTVLNIMIIKLTNNYMAYLFLCGVNTNLSYYICKMYIKRNYPGYFAKYKIEKNIFIELKEFMAMAVHTLSNTLIKHSDTVLMSIIAGLSETGFYSNYNLIVSGLKTCIQQLTSAVKDPFLNLSVTAEPQQTEVYIRRITFLYAIVAGVMCVTFSASADIFVHIVWGEENVIINRSTVFLMALSLYILVISNPVVDYYYCKDHYRNDRISPLIEVGVNAVISFVLGKTLGINGIIIGTIVAYIYRLIHRTIVIYRNMDRKLCVRYLCIVSGAVGLTMCMSVLFRTFVNIFVKTYTMCSFVLVAAFSLILSSFILCLTFHKTSEFLYYKRYILEILNRFRLFGN